MIDTSSLHSATTPRLSFGITGDPLGHSLSPALHNWVYAQLGIEASYQAWPTSPAQLKNFLNQVRKERLNGVSVTIPHKQAIIPWLDGMAPSALQTGAVNTLVWEGENLIGHNTDLAGFLDPLFERRFFAQNVLVLGAGGATRAVLAGLTSLSPRPKICISARKIEVSEQLAEEFDARPLLWEERALCHADLVVNTTSLGMKGGKGEGATPLNREDFRLVRPGGAPCLAYDLVYSPLRTPFIEAAQTAGWDTQDGLDMLIAQGLEQIRLWTGIENLPSREITRAALCERLSKNVL